MRGRFADLVAAGPRQLPAIYDALGARLSAAAGFEAACIGGAALAASQLGLPDIGLHGLAALRDVTRRVRATSSLALLVDADDGFGDVRAVRHAVRALEADGADALTLEDLVCPPALTGPPAIVSREGIAAKLAAACAARQTPGLWVVGRTDAAPIAGLDEALARAALFESLGVDAILVNGLDDLEAMRRLRATVQVPLITVAAAGTGRFAPSFAACRAEGFALLVHPAALLLAQLGSGAETLAALAADRRAPYETGENYRKLAALTAMPGPSAD